MKALDIANEIYNELEGDSSITVTSINAWLLNNVGVFNNKTFSDIAIVDFEFSPEPNEEQKVIMKQMFYCYFYGKKVRLNLGASQYDWSEISEGDSRIRRVSKNEVAKSYVTLQKDCNELLNDLIAHYKISQGTPGCLASFDADLLRYQRIE